MKVFNCCPPFWGCTDLNRDNLPYGSIGFLNSRDRHSYRGFPLSLSIERQTDSETLKILYFNPENGEWIKAGELCQRSEFYNRTDVKHLLDPIFDKIVGENNRVHWE